MGGRFYESKVRKNYVSEPKEKSLMFNELFRRKLEKLLTLKGSEHLKN